MWEIYVQGMLEHGDWALVWDSIEEEPFFGQFFTAESMKGVYGESGVFIGSSFSGPLEEVVTHIMRIKAPEGQRGHWE